MRIGIKNKSTIWGIRVCCLFLLALSTFFWHSLGFVGALIVTFLMDRFWPKWASELSWEDIYVALCNLSVFGVNGSRLHLRFSGRQLFACRDTRKEKKRLAVMLFTDEWIDLFPTTKALKDYAKKMKAVCYIENAYHKEVCILKPKTQENMEQECFRILKHTFNLTGKSISTDVVACVDSIKRVAWIQYDDVDYLLREAS